MIYLPIFFCVASLVVWDIQSKANFRHFHHKYLTKKPFQFSLVFHVDWYKLTSKPSETNSGTYANIYQGFILNLGLNHIQYAVFTSNQTKNMWFVQLIRTWTVPLLTFMYTKSYPIYKYTSIHPWFKDKYIGADHQCVCLTVACPTNWQRSWQVFMGSLFNPLLNEFRNCS